METLSRRTIVTIIVMCNIEMNTLYLFQHVHLYNYDYNSIELVQFIFNRLFIFITQDL